MGCGDFERFEAEAFYGGEDIIGGFGPDGRRGGFERYRRPGPELGIPVRSVDGHLEDGYPEWRARGLALRIESLTLLTVIAA